MPATISVSVEIRGTVDEVWRVVSDIDSEPRFWKGTRDVRNISRDGNVVTREVTMAFRDQKCLQEVTITPKEEVRTRFVRGVISGEKVVSLSPGDGGTVTVRTTWEIGLAGMMGMFTAVIKRHVRSGTEQAMQAIKREIER